MFGMPNGTGVIQIVNFPKVNFMYEWKLPCDIILSVL